MFSYFLLLRPKESMQRKGRSGKETSMFLLPAAVVRDGRVVAKF